MKVLCAVKSINFTNIILYSQLIDHNFNIPVKNSVFGSYEYKKRTTTWFLAAFHSWKLLNSKDKIIVTFTYKKLKWYMKATIVQTISDEKTGAANVRLYFFTLFGLFN